MLKKEGFTLVELLAVIVILAIILAIAVPGISGIIENSKQGAFESDAKMIITGIEYADLEASINTSATAPTVGDITATVGTYGADATNYDAVYIIDMDPIMVCVETVSTSSFGTRSGVATKSTVMTLADFDTASASVELNDTNDCAEIAAEYSVAEN